MSSAGRAASSSGCVGRPRGHETGLTGYAESIQHSSPTGSSVMETAEHREPYESRGSRTDLGAPGGESPLGDSTSRAVRAAQAEGPLWVEPGRLLVTRRTGAIERISANSIATTAPTRSRQSFRPRTD